MLKYPAWRYDEFLNLKISPFLWFSLLYGIRHFFFTIFTYINPNFFPDLLFINLQSNPWLMVTDLAAIQVLLATPHRTVNAMPFKRWIWLNGRNLLLASYSLGILIFVIINFKDLFNIHSFNFEVKLFFVLFDTAIMILLIRSKLIHDIFNDFPAPRKGQA